MIYIIFYFLFYANPLPFLYPRSLNLHNRQVDDHVTGEEEEVLLEGVGMEVEEEGRIATTTINHWKGRRERRWQSKR